MNGIYLGVTKEKTPIFITSYLGVLPGDYSLNVYNGEKIHHVRGKKYIPAGVLNVKSIIEVILDRVKGELSFKVDEKDFGVAY